MRQQRKIIDRASYEWATELANERERSMRNRLAAFDSDREEATRLKQAYCKSCYYLMAGAMAGQAMTQRPCGLCARDVMHGNTNCPVLCLACAQAKGLCRMCGGDITGRKRRNLVLNPSPTAKES